MRSDRTYSNPNTAAQKQILSKLVFFVPGESKDKAIEAVFAAGAGQIGEYMDCSFQVTGMGTYTPSERANPHIGQRGVPQYEEEVR